MLEWKFIREARKYDGWRKVVRRRFELPNGKEDDFDIYFDPEVAAVLPLTANNEVVVAKQFRPGPQKIMWEIPGGYIEKGEDAEVSAERELLEETGYSGELISTGVSYLSAYSTMVKHHFVAINCKKQHDGKVDEGEFIEVSLIPLAEFVTALQNGQLTDSETAYRGLIHQKLI